MAAEEGEGKLLRVTDLTVFQYVIKTGGEDIPILGINLLLENGDAFQMFNIPYDVAVAINAIKGRGRHPTRMSLFDLLANYNEFKELLANHLRRVVIDEVNRRTGLYTATVHFEEDGFETRVKMIPSHAIYLALLVDAPIYVSEDLLRYQEEEMSEE